MSKYETEELEWVFENIDTKIDILQFVVCGVEEGQEPIVVEIPLDDENAKKDILEILNDEKDSMNILEVEGVMDSEGNSIIVYLELNEDDEPNITPKVLESVSRFIDRNRG